MIILRKDWVVFASLKIQLYLTDVFIYYYEECEKQYIQDISSTGSKWLSSIYTKWSQKSFDTINSCVSVTRPILQVGLWFEPERDRFYQTYLFKSLHMKKYLCDSPRHDDKLHPVVSRYWRFWEAWNQFLIAVVSRSTPNPW